MRLRWKWTTKGNLLLVGGANNQIYAAVSECKDGGYSFGLLDAGGRCYYRSDTAYDSADIAAEVAMSSLNL